MEVLLAELGNPHLSFPTIHVGGTSGKGSTATMIAASLTAAGFRCGLHTKPHLSSMTERMRIDGRTIYEDRFGVLLSLMRPAIDDVARRLSRPTYFETLLALAFVHFAEEKVDVAVIEVGLGGKLDGTNLIEPLVSVITNVGLDHREILGDTVEEIAADKAGIAKPGVPLVSDAVTPAREIVAQACAAVDAPFLPVRDLVRIEAVSATPQGQHFRVTTPLATYDVGTPLIGEFQQRNAATAILALEQLPAALRPDAAAVEHAFSLLLIPGRMELIAAHPAVLFDTAHNPDKMNGLVSSLEKLFPGRRLHFVVAISDNKEVEPMLAALQRLPASFIFTSFSTNGRKAMRPDRLATYMQDSGIWVRVIEDPVEAFGVARRSAAADDLVVVTGSTVVVGAIRSWWTANMLPSS